MQILAIPMCLLYVVFNDSAILVPSPLRSLAGHIDVLVCKESIVLIFTENWKKFLESTSAAFVVFFSFVSMSLANPLILATVRLRFH